MAIKDVDLQVDEGKILGIIGPNGAGKTTFFSLISGFHSPSSGKILYNGKDVTTLKPHQFCERGIARTLQHSRPFLRLTVVQNVMVGSIFGRSGAKMEDARTLAMKQIGELGLAEKAHAKGFDLNLGEMKRLEIARALAARPRLLLLDEPVAGLNPTETNWLIGLIRRISKSGVTIVLIEHVLKAVMTLCEKIVVLNHGEKIAEGKPEEIVSNQLVIEAYLGKGKVL